MSLCLERMGGRRERQRRKAEAGIGSRQTTSADELVCHRGDTAVRHSGPTDGGPEERRAEEHRLPRQSLIHKDMSPIIDVVGFGKNRVFYKAAGCGNIPGGAFV